MIKRWAKQATDLFRSITRVNIRFALTGFFFGLVAMAALRITITEKSFVGKDQAIEHNCAYRKVHAEAGKRATSEFCWSDNNRCRAE